MKKINKSQIFQFDNTYINLPKNFYQKIKPVPVKKPRLLKLNHELSNYFNLDMKSLLADRFYRIEYKIVSGSGTSDETIQYFTYLPSFKVVR